MSTGDMKLTWNRSDGLRAERCSSPDASLLFGALGYERPRGGFGSGWLPSVVDELVMRGYDLATLRMTARWYRHPWIEPGALVYHRKDGSWWRVHHVRWERGTGRVLLTHPKTSSEAVDLRTCGHLYQPLTAVEREYAPWPHPRSWLNAEARSALRPWCVLCGTFRERREGKLVCPKCTAEGRQPNRLVEALVDGRR